MTDRYEKRVKLLEARSKLAQHILSGGLDDHVFMMVSGELPLSEDMAGETKDVVLDVMKYVSRLTGNQRKAFMEEFLDHVCWRCGTELPKYGPCESCNALRPDEVPG